MSFSAIRDFGGIQSDSDYGYVAHQEGCHMDNNRFVAHIDFHHDIADNEPEMVELLEDFGPYTAGMDANNLQNYQGGIHRPGNDICNSVSFFSCL